MSLAAADLQNPFRPQRYPVIRPIVEAENEVAHSLADMVCGRILGQIVGGELAAGARLKSTELAATLGVSRTPVAKALAKLSADGILSQPNNHQAVVSSEAAQWLLQTHELRILLEPEAAARSIGRIPADAMEDLWMLSRDAKPTRKYDWTPAARFFDFALHLSIAEYCGNLPMAVSIRKCWSYKRLSYELAGDRQRPLKSEYDQHVSILTAIAEGKSQRAHAEMLAHLQAASRTRFGDRVV